MGLPKVYRQFKHTFVPDGRVPDYKGPERSREEWLGIFVDILLARGIRVYALFGTALGFVRDGGIIPYDSDADLGIMVGDLDGFVLLREVFFEAGIYLNSRRDFFVSFLACGCEFGFEIWPIMKVTNPIYRLFGYRWLLGRVYYRDDWFGSPELFEFQGRSYWVPSPSDGYLKQLYGPQWKIPLEGHCSIPRPVFSRCLNWFFVSFDMPGQFSGMDHLGTFRPWMSWILLRFFPKASLSSRFRHPDC